MPNPFHELQRTLAAGWRCAETCKQVRGRAHRSSWQTCGRRGKFGRNAADAESMALARLGNMDDLAKAMIEKRQFQSWCARAPWAMFSIAPTLVLAAAWGDCPVHTVVRLEYLPARSRHAFRRPPGRWVRESLFSIWQGDLFLRANTCRLGNRSVSVSSTIEGDLARRRPHADRADRRRFQRSGRSHSRSRWTRAYPHGLLLCTHRSRRLSLLLGTGRHPSNHHGSALSYLETAAGLQALGLIRL